VKIIQKFGSRFPTIMGKRRIQNVIKSRKRIVIQNLNSKRKLMVQKKVNHKISVKKLAIQHYVAKTELTRIIK